MHLIKWVKILELNYKKLDKCYDLYIYILTEIILM